MKNWQDKIKEGMKLIIEGCKEQTSWVNCCECPFDEICTAIMKSHDTDYYTPDNWEDVNIYLGKN